MAKDPSGHSSTAASTHSPSLHEDGDEGAAQEPLPSGEAPAGIPQSPSVATESSKPADVATSIARAAESQPMTASNSSSSNPSIKEAAPGGTGAAVPYGTRSRNRTGTSRPNYAEDKELDAEFEVASSSKDTSGRKSARAIDSVTDAGRPTSNVRKNPVPEIEHTLTIQSHYKEPIPGTSTFSANPAATVPSHHSKKRKAPSQPTTFQPQLQNPAQNLAIPQAVTRRASMAAQVAAGFRDSNMLSFENCAGRLSGKKLVADDGTVLEVNGIFFVACL
jgi:hypothetical protein